MQPKARARMRGYVVVNEAPPVEPTDPHVWLVNRLQKDGDGQPLMEGIFANYNDDIVLEADEQTLVGRIDPARGPTQRVGLGYNLYFEDGKLNSTWGGDRGPPGPMGPPGPQGEEGPAGASSSMWLYRFDSNIAANGPGAGRLRFNSTNMQSVTRIYFDRLTQDGLDPTIAFTAATFEDEFIIQERGMSYHNMTWRLLGPAINRTGWFEVPVAWVSQAGSNFNNNLEITVVLRSRGQPGPQGPQGVQGQVGPQGPAGVQGPKGDVGPYGPQGIKGNTGDTGPQGGTGPIGPIGPQGIKGDTGNIGPKGDQGDQGVIGPTGNTGQQGPQGIQGEKGDPGSLGADEAPMDGKIYGRKNEDWAEIISDVTKAYVDAEVAKQVAASGDTMSGALVVTPKGSTFGSAGGTLSTGAVTPADANIKFYDYGGGNWAGFGADTSGDVWLRTGLSGTPTPAIRIANNKNVTFTGEIILLGTRMNLDYAGSSPASGPAIRWTNGTYANMAGLYVNGGLVFQGDAGNPTFKVTAPTTDGTMGALKVSLQGTDGVVVAAGYNAGSRGFSPSNVDAASFLATSSSFGGGLTLIDGAYRACMWAQSANLALATGGNPPAIKLLLQNDNNHQITGGLTASGELKARGNVIRWGTDTQYMYFDGTNFHLNGAGYLNAPFPIRVSRVGEQFRQRGSVYGMVHYNDDTYYYMLVTGAWDPDGGWNSLRPFYFNLGNGNVVMGHNLNVNSINTTSIDCSGNIWCKGTVLYLSPQGHYIQWAEGYYYNFPHGNIYAGGRWVAREGGSATFTDLYTSSNMHSNGNHVFFNNDASWIRWRGDLTRFDTSHGFVFTDIATSNIQCKSTGNWYHFNWEGTLVAYIDNGNWGSVLNVHSDYRLKKDVTLLQSMWDVVKSLRPVKFTSAGWEPYSKSNDIEQWGFLAHELQEAMLPTVATGSKDYVGPPQQPNPLAILATVTKALQEAMERIEQLEGKIVHG